MDGDRVTEDQEAFAASCGSENFDLTKATLHESYDIETNTARATTVGVIVVRAKAARTHTQKTF